MAQTQATQQTTGPASDKASAGSEGERREQQSEIAAENRQSAVEGSDDYLRRNSQGPDAAKAAVGKPAPDADGDAAEPHAPSSPV